MLIDLMSQQNNKTSRKRESKNKMILIDYPVSDHEKYRIYMSINIR